MVKSYNTDSPPPPFSVFSRFPTIGIRARLLLIIVIVGRNIKDRGEPGRRIYQKGTYVQWNKFYVLESEDHDLYSITWS